METKACNQPDHAGPHELSLSEFYLKPRSPGGRDPRVQHVQAPSAEPAEPCLPRDVPGPLRPGLRVLRGNGRAGDRPHRRELAGSGLYGHPAARLARQQRFPGRLPGALPGL